MGETFFNNGSSKARGVSILVNRGVLECVNDGDGRLLGISFRSGKKYMKLINIYAPNEEKQRKEFFDRMGECL